MVRTSYKSSYSICLYQTSGCSANPRCQCDVTGLLKPLPSRPPARPSSAACPTFGGIPQEPEHGMQLLSSLFSFALAQFFSSLGTPSRFAWMRLVLALHLRYLPVVQNHGASTSPVGLITSESTMSLECQVPSTDCTE